jgi:hypothetical protein
MKVCGYVTIDKDMLHTGRNKEQIKSPCPLLKKELPGFQWVKIK